MALEGFGKRLRAVRKDRGYTQKRLASSLGVTEQAVSKWERETSYPDISMLDGISKILDCSLDYLFQFEHGRKNLLNQNSVEHKAEINGLLLPDIISVEFGYELVPLFADEIEKGFPHITQLRKQMALQWGIIVPAIRMLDKGGMSASEYQICVHGIPVYTDVQKESDEKSLLQIMENLRMQIFQNIEIIMNNQIVYLMVENLRQDFPYVVENIVPERISYSLLGQVLIHLLRDYKYTVSPLVLIIQIMEKYIDCDGMEPKVLAEKVCQEMPEGFAFEHWIDRRG